MKKILIIEDEEYLAQMYQMKLRYEGYDAEYALDGQAGVDAAIKFKPDLILLDIVMPVMDGYKTLEVLRELPGTCDTPIFIFSNLGQTEEIEKGLAQGANGYMVKASMTPSQLVEKIDSVLENTRSTTTVSARSGKADLTDTCKPANGRHVLIVEDQTDIAEMYEFSFKKEGYEVTVANNGVWGAELAGRDKFDVIILDIVMPEMDGLSVLGNIRKGALNHDSLILVLSNSGQEGDIAHAKSLGADHYFIKARLTPINLVQEVNRLLGL